MDNIRELIEGNATAANIFIFLTKHMNKVNAISCSQKLLVEITGKSRITVQRAIKYLEEKQFINILKQGNTNIYVMNPSVVWSSTKWNRKYCSFEGKMLVSKSENEKFFRDNFNTLQQNMMIK